MKKSLLPLSTFMKDLGLPGFPTTVCFLENTSDELLRNKEMLVRKHLDLDFKGPNFLAPLSVNCYGASALRISRLLGNPPGELPKN